MDARNGTIHTHTSTHTHTVITFADLSKGFSPDQFSHTSVYTRAPGSLLEYGCGDDREAACPGCAWVVIVLGCGTIANSTITTWTADDWDWGYLAVAGHCQARLRKLSYQPNSRIPRRPLPPSTLAWTGVTHVHDISWAFSIFPFMTSARL